MPTANVSSPARSQPQRTRPLRLKIHSVLRWLHIYISMLCLLIILFFALTGITLNHQEWTFGTAETRTQVGGTLPANWKTTKGVDWLLVAEYLRQQHHLRGSVSDHPEERDDRSLSFKAPGYEANIFIDDKTGGYQVTIIAQGMVGLMNDLHRGHDSGKTWGWAIDITGGFLALISLTGFGLLIYLKNVRRAALITLCVGTILVLLLMRFAG